MSLEKLRPYLDLEQALPRLMGNEELLITILGLMLDDFKAERENFATLVKKRDAKGVSDKAHYYKGIAANLNVLNVLELSQNIERNSISNNWVAVDADFVDLCVQMEKLDQVFKEIKAVYRLRPAGNFLPESTRHEYCTSSLPDSIISESACRHLRPTAFRDVLLLGVRFFL